MTAKKKKKALFIVVRMHGELGPAFTTRAKMNRWLAPFARKMVSVKNLDVDPTPRWPKGMKSFAVEWHEELQEIDACVIDRAPRVASGVTMTHHTDWMFECWARDRDHAVEQFTAALAKIGVKLDEPPPRTEASGCPMCDRC